MKILKENKSSLILLLSMFIGAILGLILGESAKSLQGVANIFLNLLYVSIVPMIFTSIVSSITGMKTTKTIGKILGLMFLIFIITGLFAALYMIVFTQILDPSKNAVLNFKDFEIEKSPSIDLLSMLTVDDFSKLLSRENLMALIVFSFFVGLAISKLADEARLVKYFIDQSSKVVTKIISYIMKLAPIGLGAYFAVLLGENGKQIVGPLSRTILIFALASIIYFFFVNFIMAFIGGGLKSCKRLFTYMWPPVLTAFGTSSSAAALPPNLEAGRKIGIREDVNSIVLPIGANLHKDGTVLIQIIKIALLCPIFGIDLLDPSNLLTAIAVSVIASSVMGAVPGGGYTGEIFLISAFAFPQSSIPIMVLIATIVDPLATAINTSTDLGAAMIVERFVK